MPGTQQADNSLLPTAVLVIIPVQNEQGSIGAVVRAVRGHYGFDVAVVDDASTDNSIAEAREAGAAVLPLCMRLGAWSAMQTGMRYALKAGYEFVVTMDGDGQHPGEGIDTLFEAMQRTEADVVIGACTSRGSALRQWAWRYFRRLTGIGIEDITSGFRLYNRRAFQLLTSPQATLLDYQDVGVLLRLQEARMAVTEVSVCMAPRRMGISRVYYSWPAVAYYMVLTTVLSVSKGRPLKLKRYESAGRPRESV